MDSVLIVNGQSVPQESCAAQFIYVVKISALVLLTYGLMIAMFEVWYITLHAAFYSRPSAPLSLPATLLVEASFLGSSCSRLPSGVLLGAGVRGREKL